MNANRKWVRAVAIIICIAMVVTSGILVMGMF